MLRNLAHYAVVRSIMVGIDKPEGAISWFEIWKRGYPDDPALKNYKDKLSLIETFTKLQNGLPNSRGANRKRVN